MLGDYDGESLRFCAVHGPVAQRADNLGIALHEKRFDIADIRYRSFARSVTSARREERETQTDPTP